jgi:hypothetical protein
MPLFDVAIDRGNDRYLFPKIDAPAHKAAHVAARTAPLALAIRISPAIGNVKSDEPVSFTGFAK